MDLIPVAKAYRKQSPTTNPSDGPVRRLFLRGRPHADADEDSRCYLDASRLCREELPDDLLSEARESMADTVVVDHFHEGLDDVEVADKKRTLLEQLAGLEKNLEVYSDIDPLCYLRDRQFEEASAESTPIDLAAWAAVLRKFRRESGTLANAESCFESLEEVRDALGLAENRRVEKRLRYLAEECRSDAYLRNNVGHAVAVNRELEALTEEQIAEEVRYRAEAHYQHLWMTCSHREKIILHRISTDGFVSPHGDDVVEQLLRRGLLVMDPALRPMNDSFKQFVARIESPVIAQYEQEASSSAWKRMRTPLLLVFGVVIAFVFITQPDVARETAALVPTLAAGLPVLLKVVAGLFGGRSGTMGGGP